MTVAVSTGVAIAYVLVWVALIVTPGVVTWLKGRADFVAAGLLVGGILWAVSCWRLAKPSSWWARRFYGPAKLERARLRYGG